MIILEGVGLAYDRQEAVAQLSGRFADGSLTAIVGPNGAGKTTLLRAIAGLHPIAAGRLDRGTLRPADIALLPQASRLDRSFPVTCRDIVALGAFPHTGALRAIGAAPLAAAEAALEAVGLPGFAPRPISSLSAGQFQRVLFARLIVQDARLLLLDEPFSAVDTRTEADLTALLHAWHGQGRTILVVLHDLELVARAFPQTLLLARHAIAWGPTEVALSAAYRQRARLASEGWSEDAERRRPAA
jgi:zinc/manganese transport system ATP-binding protein